MNKVFHFSFILPFNFLIIFQQQRNMKEIRNMSSKPFSLQVFDLWLFSCCNVYIVGHFLATQFHPPFHCHYIGSLSLSSTNASMDMIATNFLLLALSSVFLTRTTHLNIIKKVNFLYPSCIKIIIQHFLSLQH